MTGSEQPTPPKPPSVLERVRERFSSIPRHVFGGIRTTTLVLVILFAGVLVLWNNVRFDPTMNEDSPVYDPPAVTTPTEAPQPQWTPTVTRTPSATTTPSTTGTVTPTPGATNGTTPGQTTTTPPATTTTTNPGFQLPTIPGFQLPNFAPTPTLTPNP